MKKIVIVAFLVILFGLFSCAFCKSFDSISYEAIVKAQNRIDEVGFRILNSNNIPNRTVFDFSTKSVKNAFSRHSDRQIVIYKNLYIRFSSDDELASVLAHEISHSVDSYDGIFKGYFSGLSYYLAPKKYETKADKRAVDYMVKAGYNPVAYIIVMNKVMGENRYEWCSTHPVTSKRMMTVYEYIYRKYPQYLANNVYKDNIYYQNFLLTSKAQRKKFQNKISEEN